MNKFYDIIVAQYKTYLEYNDFVEKEKQSLDQRRKDILKKVLDTPEAEVTDEIESMVFDLLLQQRLYNNDAQMLFYNLYKAVDIYLQMEEAQVLPQDITKLCEDLAFTVPNTIFVVEKDKFNERRKGQTEEIKTAWYKSGEIKALAENFKKQLNTTPD